MKMLPDDGLMRQQAGKKDRPKYFEHVRSLSGAKQTRPMGRLFHPLEERRRVA
jgi:hypothetical protein